MNTIPGVYCDHIANIIKKGLQSERGSSIAVQYVGPVQFDLDSQGAFKSTTKRIAVVDLYNTEYIVTVEEKRNFQTRMHQAQMLEHEVRQLHEELARTEQALKDARAHV